MRSAVNEQMVLDHENDSTGGLEAEESKHHVAEQTANTLHEQGIEEVEAGQESAGYFTGEHGEENLARMVEEISSRDQDSSGVLNSTPHENKFLVRARSIESLAPDMLEPVEHIEDYIEASDATRPIVLHTPEGYFVLDGQHYISAAIASGETSIECEVDFVGEHNLMDLCLRKAGIRSQTRGGRARYAELVRNAIKLERLLLSENSDLKSFGHGGRRFGEGFVGDSEMDIRTILEVRLSKSRTTINHYLAHGKYLSDEVLALLVDGSKDKEYFRKVERLKRIKVKKLEEQRKTHDEIKSEISAFVRQCVESGIPEIPRAPQIPSQPDPDPQGEEPPDAEIDDVEVGDDDDDQEEEQPHSEHSDVDPMITLKSSTLAVSARLSQRIEASNDATSLYEAVTDEIRALTEILARIHQMAGPNSRNEAEAA